MKFNWKKLIAGALATISVASLAATAAVRPTTVNAASNPSSVSAIKKRGVLKVAVFGDLPPYGWVNKNGKRVGYDVPWLGKWQKTLA